MRLVGWLEVAGSRASFFNLVDWSILDLDLPDADVPFCSLFTFHLGHGEYINIPKLWLYVGLP